MLKNTSSDHVFFKICLPCWMVMASWMTYSYHICVTISMLGIATLWRVRLCEPSYCFWGERLPYLHLLLPFSSWHYWYGLCLMFLGFCGRGVYFAKWMTLLSLLATWSWFVTRQSWEVNSYSGLPLCSDVVASNFMSVSSSWCESGWRYLLSHFACLTLSCCWLLQVGGALFPWCGRFVFFSCKSCWSCLCWPFYVADFILVMVVVGASSFGAIYLGWWYWSWDGCKVG